MTRRSLAPDYDVPENVSPFALLPVLTRCACCREPQNPLHLWSAVQGGEYVSDLCERCATTHRPETTTDAREANPHG